MGHRSLGRGVTAPAGAVSLSLDGVGEGSALLKTENNSQVPASILADNFNFLDEFSKVEPAL